MDSTGHCSETTPQERQQPDRSVPPSGADGSPPNRGDAPPGEATAPNGPLRAALRQARRLVILVVGGTVLLVGIIMIVAPGPATIVIPIGLGILAIEFAWARRLLKRVRSGIDTTVGRVMGKKQPPKD